jgi:hypothetical protein
MHAIEDPEVRRYRTLRAAAGAAILAGFAGLMVGLSANPGEARPAAHRVPDASAVELPPAEESQPPTF